MNVDEDRVAYILSEGISNDALTRRIYRAKAAYESAEDDYLKDRWMKRYLDLSVVKAYRNLGVLVINSTS